MKVDIKDDHTRPDNLTKVQVPRSSLSLFLGVWGGVAADALSRPTAHLGGQRFSSSSTERAQPAPGPGLRLPG